MRKIFAGFMLIATTVSAAGEPPVAAVPPSAPVAMEAVPYTGAHTADLMPTPDGVVQPVAFCETANRYIDMRFLALKTTSAGQKEPLILKTTTSTQAAGEFNRDIYRTGVVNTTDSPGIHLLVGQWTAPDTAYEFGATYIDPFFYKRVFAAETVQGGAFSGTTTTRVTFIPTSTPLDFAYVYHKIYHWGLESNMRRRVAQDSCHWLDAILGLRYHQIHERYNIDITPVRAVGAKESYHTGNDIFGIQFGVEGDRKLCDYVSIRGVAKYMLGFNSQWQSLRGTPGAGILTTDATRGYDQDFRFGNFADLSIAIVGKLTPNIETSFGVTSLIFGGVKRAANIFDLQNVADPALKDGQDWLMLYGFQWTVKIDF
jgi:hypothetical protein